MTWKSMSVPEAITSPLVGLTMTAETMRLEAGIFPMADNVSLLVPEPFIEGLTNAVARPSLDLKAVGELFTGTEVDEVGIVTVAVSKIELDIQTPSTYVAEAACPGSASAKPSF